MVLWRKELTKKRVHRTIKRLSTCTAANTCASRSCPPIQIPRARGAMRHPMGPRQDPKWALGIMSHDRKQATHWRLCWPAVLGHARPVWVARGVGMASWQDLDYVLSKKKILFRRELNTSTLPTSGLSFSCTLGHCWYVVITRSDFKSETILGFLSPNPWIIPMCVVGRIRMDQEGDTALLDQGPHKTRLR